MRERCNGADPGVRFVDIFFPYQIDHIDVDIYNKISKF